MTVSDEFPQISRNSKDVYVCRYKYLATLGHLAKLKHAEVIAQPKRLKSATAAVLAGTVLSLQPCISSASSVNLKDADISNPERPTMNSRKRQAENEPLDTVLDLPKKDENQKASQEDFSPHKSRPRIGSRELKHLLSSNIDTQSKKSDEIVPRVNIDKQTSNAIKSSNSRHFDENYFPSAKNEDDPKIGKKIRKSLVNSSLKEEESGSQKHTGNCKMI
jgi:hypothetical protein